MNHMKESVIKMASCAQEAKYNVVCAALPGHEIQIFLVGGGMVGERMSPDSLVCVFFMHFNMCR